LCKENIVTLENIMKRLMLIVLIAGLVTSLVGSVAAFDGNHKGFLLGVGLGYAHSSFDDNSISMPLSMPHDGICLDLKVGGGVSEQVQIYWNSKVNCSYSQEASLGGFAVSGLGGTYFLKPKAPSLYFMATLGLSGYWVRETAVDVGKERGRGSATSIGFGSAIGAGYEFAKHLSVEGSVAIAKANIYWIDANQRSDVSALGLCLTLNYLAF
jgi:hypothetical protein